MFPACAGMNRIREIDQQTHRRVPRMRGDEPVIYLGSTLTGKCSPHARG